MSDYLRGLGVIVGLELRQRVRGVAWYVLLGIFTVLVAVVTLLLSIALGAWGDEIGGGVFSTIIYFVLLLGTLVAPALSGNAINGDREAGTLATTQVTLIGTSQLVLGKFLAAWVSALAFLAAAVPFLFAATLVGGVAVDTVLVSIPVLAVELGIIAAIGVGLSGLLRRPLFSIVITYLVVAALSIGTLIAFALGGLALQSQGSYTYLSPPSSSSSNQWQQPGPDDCTEATSYEQAFPRFDRVWGILSANPYVVLADAVPTQFDRQGNPSDLFGWIKLGARQAQMTPELDIVYSDCDERSWGSGPTPREVLDSTVPSWFVGFGIHIALAAGALGGAIATTRTPARHLAAGSRIA